MSERALLLLLSLWFVNVDSRKTCARHTEPRLILPASNWSTPEECARQCVDGEAPRYCYFQFNVEYYTTVGGACDLCKPERPDLPGSPQCQCIIGDGVEKTVLVINRMIPAPSIQVCLHDLVIIDIWNWAEGLEVTIHWHGVFQKFYQYYDGVPFLTQCPITSNDLFRYAFAVDNSGTHFYHSHVSVHMIDGQYGSLIVRDPEDPHKDLYDTDRPDHVILISDWMHLLSLEYYPGRYHTNVGQAPENILINGKGNWVDPDTGEATNAPRAKFVVQPGLRHRFRLINSFSTVCLAEFIIEDHDLQIIAQDGENIVPVTVNTIRLATGERVDFVLDANQAVKTYWIQVRGLGECGEKKIHQLAYLHYGNSSEAQLSSEPDYDGLPRKAGYNTDYGTYCNNKEPQKPTVCVNQLHSIEETDPGLLAEKPDHRIVLYFDFANYTDNKMTQLFQPGTYERFFVAPDRTHLESRVNNVSYQEAPAPPLAQAEGYERMCSAPTEPSTCTEPCTCTHVYHIELGKVVEIVIYDPKPLPDMEHPFHLHGYSFVVFRVGKVGGKNGTQQITKSMMDDIIKDHENDLRQGSYVRPSRKDTVVVPEGGYVIIRFRADNPGWWLYHCHFTWHTATGMDVVMHVGTKRDLPPVPKNFPKCYNFNPPPRFYNVTRKN